jgi:hypothetical protein
MKKQIASIELYKKQLEWLIEYKNILPNIIRYGQRPKDNKWWFIYAQANYSHEGYRQQLQELYNSGFSIPDFNQTEKDSQLIAEPFEEKTLSNSKVFVCPICNHHLDLNNKETFDFVRKTALQSFHNNIFTKTDI